MDRFICIHSHFYQPPRENPWLEAIELQDSAYPYHDWNERITAECYAPNGASRILDGEGRIVKIANNFAQVSFNFGPTLLAWLEAKAPDVYQAILYADRESRDRFSGHGSALAQAYNHVIMPLANRRDKYTQVLWGIRDFEHRFHRAPEGMWLPETAVDIETLDILAELGIRFTILAPHQASRVRKFGSRWRDVSGGRIDPSMAYEVHLPSGRKIGVFFYDGPVSRAVAFEGLLSSGEHFAHRLLSAFSDKRNWPQLVHIATDGETYGHHHRHGEMALAYALQYIESNGLARLTNYAEFYEKHPPTEQVEIIENTSWSCAHGIERWRSDCGCNSGGRPSWNQSWRAPLRESLDWLRDALAPRYEEMAAQFLRDPWAARNDYFKVVLDRSPTVLDEFFRQHANRQFNADEKIRVLKLLEIQRHAMLMFTSCGWFFDELSGIETVQVIQYAGRAIQLAEELFSESQEPAFLERLEQAKSNLSEHGDARRIYEKFVKPAVVDLAKVGAHYAMSSLFEEYPEQTEIYCYRVSRDDYRVLETGRAKLAVGRLEITSGVTSESASLSFGVLHFGDHNLSGGVRSDSDDSPYHQMVEDVTEAFRRADFPQTIRQLDRHFLAAAYSLKSLFRDEQRKILQMILDSTLRDVESEYRQLYERHAPLMGFLTELNTPLPRALQTVAEFVLNLDLRRAFENEEPNLDLIKRLLEEVRMWRVGLDAAGLSYAIDWRVEQLVKRLSREPDSFSLFESTAAFVNLVKSLAFEVDFWGAQNIFYDMLQELYPQYRSRADEGDTDAQAWVSHFNALGHNLGIRVA